MWLIHTTILRLTAFPSPPNQYAILSHVWQENEITFQAFQADVLRLNNKIVKACEYAKSEGFEWLWIDTCCIDKTDSTELSEAINSMFAWYSKATVCYAYLADVPNAVTLRHHITAFKESRWHTRGWTLQELVASPEVRFLSADWEFIGNKNFMGSILEEITGIRRDVLQHRNLSSISVAERMSWASRRQTTRIEDEAYSLMGIFDVNIPVIYGEGRRAFRRLQEEIMRTSPDHTLFIWGSPISPMSTTVCMCPQGLSERRTQDFNLLAPFPSLFDRPNRAQPDVIPLPKFSSTLEMLAPQSAQDSPNTMPLLAYELPMFTVTSYGIRARLPIVPLTSMTLVKSDSATTASGSDPSPNEDLFLALLACAFQSDPGAPTDVVIGLILRRPHGSHVLHVGVPPTHGGVEYGRYIDVTPDVSKRITSNGALDWRKLWQTVYISQSSVPDAPLQPERPISTPGISAVRIVVPSFVLGNLQAQNLACIISQPAGGANVGRRFQRTPQALSYILRTPSTAPSPYLRLHNNRNGHSICVRFGLCEDLLWAEARELEAADATLAESPPADASRPCLHSHVCEWPGFVPSGEHGGVALEWNYSHSFDAGSRRVHVRVAGQPRVMGRADPILVGIEVDLDDADSSS